MLQTWDGTRFLIKETCHAAGKALRSTEQAVSNHSTVRVSHTVPSLHHYGYIQTFAVSRYIFNFVIFF